MDALFIGRGGKPLTKAGIQRAVKRIGERAGVMKVYCHRFRHTLASNLATKMPVAEVAAILGHDSIATTQGGLCAFRSGAIVARLQARDGIMTFIVTSISRNARKHGTKCLF